MDEVICWKLQCRREIGFTQDDALGELGEQMDFFGLWGPYGLHYDSIAEALVWSIGTLALLLAVI